MANSIVWFDIQLKNLKEAIPFYSAVVGVPLKIDTHGDFQMVVLPHAGEDVGGCLYEDPSAETVQKGFLPYFNAEGRLLDTLKKVGECGGKIIEEKQQIGPYGFRAIVQDPAGNRIALHSMKDS